MISTFLSCIQSLTFFAQWHGALSSWNSHRRRVSGNNTSEPGSIFLLRAEMYFWSFMIFWHSSRNPTPNTARCFSVGLMRSGFHSSPHRLLKNEFQEWLPTSNFDSSENNTLCHSDHVQFSWACAQANWHFLFVSMVLLQARQPLIPLSARRWSTVLVLVYTRFTIDPENVGSPYTVSQATLAECLRETYCQRAFSLQLPLPQWNTNIRSIQTYFADLRCEKWWIKL